MFEKPSKAEEDRRRACHGHKYPCSGVCRVHTDRATGRRYRLRYHEAGTMRNPDVRGSYWYRVYEEA